MVFSKRFVMKRDEYMGNKTLLLHLASVRCCLVTTLLVLLCDLVVVIYAQRCSNPLMGDEKFPLQMIPVSSFSSSQINYSMWTPTNWTTTTSTTTMTPNTALFLSCIKPKLQNNVYLLSTTNSQSFQVIVPFLSKSRTTTTNSKKARTSSVASKNNNAIRIDNVQQRNHFTTTTTTTTPFSFHSKLHYNVRKQQSVQLQRTSIQSMNHQCEYAMNGGPFNADGSMVGVVIAQNGTFISNDFGPNIGFGIATVHNDTTGNGTTSGSSSYWVIGRIDNVTQARTLGIEQFVTGFDWLVYNDTNIVSYRNNTTGALRASRSTIGITSDGTVLLLVTDGCEHCFRRQGMTLSETADLLLYFGAQYAINMDGGSSSVLVQSGNNNMSNILNQPTCYYNAIIPPKWMSCDRSVATVICLKRYSE